MPALKMRFGLDGMVNLGDRSTRLALVLRASGTSSVALLGHSSQSQVYAVISIYLYFCPLPRCEKRMNRLLYGRERVKTIG